MKNIQMVDLIGQYEKIQKEMDEAVIGSIRSSAYINGPDVKTFAQEMKDYLGVQHAIPCANGTDALQIALMALGLEPGDEVITPSFTYVATAEVICLLKLTPVFVEVYPDTFTINTEALEKAITPKTKAVIAVHLYGQCANMEEILKIGQKHNIYVVEDTAQALGSEYTFQDGTTKKAAAMGTVGTISFFPSKNLGCYGDGGMICTNDDQLAQTLSMVANHGQSKKYYHDLIGVNSRLDTLQAAILRVKLPYLNDYVAARRKVAEYYDAAFADIPGIIIPIKSPDTKHTYHQYTMQVEGNRDELISFLRSRNIPSMIYYPVPLHLQKGYVDYEYFRGSLPITEKLCEDVISLPVHTEMDMEQLELITSSVKEFFIHKLASSPQNT